MLKFSLRNKIIAGFVSAGILLILINTVGMFSVKIIDYGENMLVAAYKIRSAILECRMLEKNSIFRAYYAERLTAWSKSFKRLQLEINRAKNSRYIDFEDSERLNESLIRYKHLSDAALRDLHTNRVLTNEERESYDAKFKNEGQKLFALSDNIINKGLKKEQSIDTNIFLLLVFCSACGVIFSLLLTFYMAKMTDSSFKKIENLSGELERNYLELALGLSEHFEVLKRVSKGELNIKSPENSTNELLSKLGSVINQTIARLNEYSRKEFEEAFILSASGIRIVDKDFNIIKANRAMEELSGVSIDGMTGTKCYTYFKGFHCHTDKCTLKQILSGAEKVEKEEERQKADGSRLFCLLKAIPLKDKEGNIIGMMQDFSNISKLKIYEEEIARQSVIFAVALSEVFEALNRVSGGDLSVRLKEESENDLLAKLNKVVNQTIANLKKSWDDLASSKIYSENIIESIKDMIFVVDPALNIRTVNSAASQVLGYTREELVGQPVRDIFSEKNKPFELSGVTKLIGGNELNNYEIYCVSKTGAKIPVLLNYSTIKNKEGIISYMVCTAKDITERKNMEETLRKSEESYRNVVEISPDVIALLDLDLNVLMVNKSGVDLYGYGNSSDMVGKSIAQFVDPQEILKAIDYRNKIMEEGEIKNIEIISKRKDGSNFLIELNAALIKDKDKNPEAILVVFHDITARKQAEKELKEAYDKLKELQSQLVQAEKMAAIGQLAGGVAHEINNPLTGVLNNVQLVKMISEEKKDFKIDEFKDLLSVIEESALRCKKITESLLDFSHASMGQFCKLSLNATIEKVNNLIANEMKLQNIFIKNELQEDLPAIKGDPQLLQQIIVNLISNAKWAIVRKFDKSGGQITIKTEHTPGSAVVNLYISDNGIGIPKEKMGKIFEPFFTTKQVGEGTGLGLSVVYNIIRRHKGNIEVESREDQGTTFKISLPAALKIDN